MNPANGKPNMAGEAADKLNAIGIDGICERIREGQSVRFIARAVGVSQGSVLGWIADTAERTAKASHARSLAVVLFEEKAEKGIEEAPNVFELARAKELAHHYRWRAAKLAPKVYGDKVFNEVQVTGTVNITTHKEHLRQLLDLNILNSGIAPVLGNVITEAPPTFQRIEQAIDVEYVATALSAPHVDNETNEPEEVNIVSILEPNFKYEPLIVSVEPVNKGKVSKKPADKPAKLDNRTPSQIAKAEYMKAYMRTKRAMNKS